MVSKKDYDCCGWATKANVKCSDGRTIMPDAFKDNDGQIVPLRKAAVGNKGDRKNMTVKEKLKQEEEKLLESVNDSYRDMMRAQFNCIFEELEERSEKSPEYAARVLLPHKSFARCMKYAMKKIMEIRTPTEKEKELARKQEAPIVTPVSADVLFEWIDEYYELDDKEAYEKEMQKQEAAQTSKKKKRTVKKPAKPLLDGLLGKEGGDAPDLKPSKVKKSRRKELDGQLSLFQI